MKFHAALRTKTKFLEGYVVKARCGWQCPVGVKNLKEEGEG